MNKPDGPITPRSRTSAQTKLAQVVDLPSVAPNVRRSRKGVSSPNLLGQCLEQRFADLDSPCHSYSELERRSGVSRAALSRYVTSRISRRRSPTVDTLAALAYVLDMPVELLCCAALNRQYIREELSLSSIDKLSQSGLWLAQLSENQFRSLLTFLAHMLKADQPDLGLT